VAAGCTVAAGVLWVWYPPDGSADDDVDVDEYEGVELDAGAVPQPAASVGVVDELDELLLAEDGVELDEGSTFVVPVEVVVPLEPDGVSAPEPAGRLRNAVTSVLVLTMPTTSQPSADFSVSLVANDAESYEEALTVVNSCGMTGRLVATPHPGATLTRVRRNAAEAAQQARRRAQVGITSAWTSVPDGGPS
jgi:hypothetical protein